MLFGSCERAAQIRVGVPSLQSPSRALAFIEGNSRGDLTSHARSSASSKRIGGHLYVSICSFSRSEKQARSPVGSWRVFATPINYELNSGEEVEFDHAPQFERLFEPFEIAPGMTLPVGD
jgi:hypothetical protein